MQSLAYCCIIWLSDIVDLGVRRKVKGFYQKCIDGMINGHISYQTRYKVQEMLDKDFLDEYCKECGVTDPNDIDWNNPIVAVAHLLHDPLYRHYILHGKDKQKQIVYNQMTPEMLNIYWNYEDEHGARFCDLEDKKKRKNDKKLYKKRE